MPIDADAARRLLTDDRRETQARRQRLLADLADVVEAASDVATDDEHDPEGATIAYERARTAALLSQADDHLRDIAVALERVEDGAYGTCEQCGQPIAAERLEARPVTRTCISCAASPRS